MKLFNTIACAVLPVDRHRGGTAAFCGYSTFGAVATHAAVVTTAPIADADGVRGLSLSGPLREPPV